jgi:hypothetical protein
VACFCGGFFLNFLYDPKFIGFSMQNELNPPVWSNMNPQQRLQLIAKARAESPEDAAMLQALACDNSDERVAHEAMAKVRDVTFLWKISSGESVLYKNIACERLAALLQEAPLSEAEVAALPLSSVPSCLNFYKIYSIALRLRLLSVMQDQEKIYEIIQKDASREVRLAAVEYLHDKNKLELLLQETFNRDKGMYRHVEQVLKRIREREERPAYVEREVAAIFNALQYVSQLERWNTPEYEQLQRIQQRWQAISAEVPEEIVQKYQGAFANCDAVKRHYLERQQQKIEDLQRQQKFIEELLAWSAQAQTLEALTAEAIADWQSRWQAVLTEETEIAQLEQVNAIWATLAKRQQQLMRRQNALAELAQLHQQLTTLHAQSDHLPSATEIKNFQERLNEIQDFLTGNVESQESLKNLTALLEELRARYTERQQLIQGIEQEIKQSLQALAEALNQNHLHDAQVQQKRLQDALHQPLLPANHNVRRLADKQLRILQPKLHELEDWQHFGSLTARESLCQRMEALIGSPLDPETLSKEIKAIQDEWKGIDKVNTVSGRKLWLRFSEAMQKAYEPCKIYFNEQNKLKDERAQQAEALVEELEALAAAQNWQETETEQVDWERLDRAVRDFRRRWYTLGEMRFRDKRNLEKRFRPILQEIENKLSEERQRNLEERKNLVAQAEALASIEDLRQAIDKAKILQKQWKVSVRGPIGQDRKLRDTFKAHCDAVFDRLRHEQEARKREQEEKVHARQALLDAIDALSQQDATDHQAIEVIKQQAKALQQQWKELPPLEREEQRDWDKKLDKHLQRLEKFLRKMARSEQSQQFDLLQQKAAFLVKMENTLPVHQDWQAAWQSLPVLADASKEQLLQQRFNEALRYHRGEISPVDWQKRLATLSSEMRQLAVRLEILVGLESPAEAAQERMAYQVSRLSQAMQRGSQQDRRDDPVDLAMDFYYKGPLSLQQWELLAPRLERVLDKVSP